MAVFRILLLTFCVCSSTAHAAITEVTQSFYGLVADNSRNWKPTFVQLSSLSIPALPDPLQINAADGNVFARGSAHWSSVGGQLIVSVDANLYRTGTIESISDLGYELEFTLQEDAAYEMSGYLNVTDIDSLESAGVVSAADLTSGGLHLYHERQLSANTHNESFVLGGMGGDRGNSFEPGSSLKGQLEAGRRYTLSFSYTLSTDTVFFPGGPDAGATAVGGFTFRLGTVPEPSSLAILPTTAIIALFRQRRSA